MNRFSDRGSTPLGSTKSAAYAAKRIENKEEIINNKCVSDDKSALLYYSFFFFLYYLFFKIIGVVK